METPLPTSAKKPFLKRDSALVCGMLIFYGACILVAGWFVFGWLGDRGREFAVQATETHSAFATLWAENTASSAARGTEQAGYELIEPFDTNLNKWRMGPENSEYWKGSTQIVSGVYIWDVREVKDGFVAWADFPGNDYIQNYDTYVDTKFAEVPPDANACSGLIFRLSPVDWDIGSYTFTICRYGYFKISYHNANGWDKIHSEYHPAIQPFDWNRVEVHVRDDHFVFLINNQQVYEVQDDRQQTGGVALMIDADASVTRILFDNFGFQSRLENDISVKATAATPGLPSQNNSATETPLSALQGTSTAIARGTDLAGYEVIDTFDSNANDWVTGSQSGLDSDHTSWITQGEYLWQIDEITEDHATVSAEFSPMNNFIRNYDVYVETKFVEDITDSTCSGLRFRQSPLDWGGYIFMICHSGHFGVYYDDRVEGWDEITFQRHDSIRPSDWNRLEILVQDSHFTFLINSQVIYEWEDDRQPVGSVALMMQVEQAGTKIAFDNFGYRTR